MRLNESRYTAALRRFRRRLCERALRRCDGNVAAAARFLGTDRSVIYQMIQRGEIAKPVDRTPAGKSGRRGNQAWRELRP